MFTWRHPLDIVVFECRIFSTGNRRNRMLFTGEKKQKFGCRSNCRYCADRAQNLPQPALTFGSHCFRFHPNRFTFGGVIAERAKAVLCPIAYFYDRLFEPITNE